MRSSFAAKPVAQPQAMRRLRQINRPASQQAVQSRLQLLFDQAQDAFRGGRTPKAPEVERLRATLRSVPLEELGITPSKQEPGWGIFGKRARSADISYTGVARTRDISIDIFYLPAGKSLPLHNHPGMTVLSRVLYGQMGVRAYDWAELDAGGRLQPVELVIDRVVQADDNPAVLFPASGGNMHTFQGVTDCAVLDILAPPYSPSEDRDCTYYREHHRDGRTYLEPIPCPPDFYTVNVRYRGVKLADTS